MSAIGNITSTMTCARQAAAKVGLWETVRMAKHKFLIGLKDDKDNIIGARCARCGKPTLFVHGQLPEEVRDEECVKEDFSQAAAKDCKRGNGR